MTTAGVRAIRAAIAALVLGALLLSSGPLAAAATRAADPGAHPGASVTDDAAALLAAVRHLQTTSRSARLGSAGEDAPCGVTSMQVVTSISGTGLDTRISLTGSPRTFTLSSIPATWWANPPETSPVWRLYFQGLMWASPVVYAQDDPVVTSRVIDLAAQFVSANRDPGTSTRGWDEGTNLRREQQLNCLYSMTQDPRLVPAITMSVAANLDPKRYYGLPNSLPHNHGLMANLALLESGRLLGKPAWRQTAITRLMRDSAGAFTPSGVSIEQASDYWWANSIAWAAVADLLDEQGTREATSTAASIRTRLITVRSALAYATTPTGALVPYGDSNTAQHEPTPQRRGVFRDDAAGLITGRWTWSDPTTSFYLIRYGGRRWAHGHEDRGSIVWQTRGVPVLIDPGKFSYDPGPYATFAKAPLAHATLIPRGKATFVPSAAVTVSTTRFSGPAHTVVLRDKQYGAPHTRALVIDNAARSLTVSDSTTFARTTQTFQLDGGWAVRARSADRKTARFTHAATGRTLTVRSTYPLALYRGSTSPVLGWNFLTYGHRYPTYQVLVYGGTAVRTVFTVS